MRRLAILVIAIPLILGAGSDGAEPTPAIGPPPIRLRLDPFYAKYLDVDGIPVVASARVPDQALIVARRIMLGLLRHRPDIARYLALRGQRVAIMAPEESTTDLPEQRDWRKPAIDDPRLTRCERKHYQERIGRLSDREYWDRRARGMAGPLTSGATEDLLGLRSSRYYGQTIFLHEFSHDVLDAIRDIDRPLYARVAAAYGAALSAGRWRDDYAATTINEYWAQGSQIWFNSGRMSMFDGRRVLSDSDLFLYDPRLYAVLREAYGDGHHIEGDPFYLSPARVPPGPPPANTAEVC